MKKMFFYILFFVLFFACSNSEKVITKRKNEIISEVKRTGKAIVVEEHSYIGGLAESISSLLSEKYPIPIKKVCLDDIFPVSVRMEEEDVYGKFGISRHEIIRSVKSIINENKR